MKEDVERRERAQATVIENQAKRLDELETLYKVRPSQAAYLAWFYVASHQKITFTLGNRAWHEAASYALCATTCGGEELQGFLLAGMSRRVQCLACTR